MGDDLLIGVGVAAAVWAVVLPWLRPRRAEYEAAAAQRPPSADSQ